MVPIDLPRTAASLNDTKACLTERTDSGGWFNETVRYVFLVSRYEEEVVGHKKLLLRLQTQSEQKCSASGS